METIEHFEIHRNSLLHVIAMPDGFICGQLLDFMDVNSVQPPRFSTLNILPAARTASPTWFSFLVSLVARLLSYPLDGISLEGGSDGHVQAHIQGERL